MEWTNYLLKTLQFKRICPTQGCTTPVPGSHLVLIGIGDRLNLGGAAHTATARSNAACWQGLYIVIQHRKKVDTNFLEDRVPTPHVGATGAREGKFRGGDVLV